MINSKAKKRATQGGFTLIAVSALAAVASVLVFAYSNSFSLTRKMTVSEEQGFEFRLLAKNILEFGKYLILYEKVFYLESPDLQDGALKSLWSKGISSKEIHEACGGYGLTGKYNGVHTVDGKLNGRKVFCPLLLRFATMSTRQLEEGFLQRYVADPGLSPWIQKPRNGVYRITLNLKDRLKLETGDFFDFFSSWSPTSASAGAGGSLTNESYRRSIGLSATLSYEIYTDSSGFVSSNTERYIKVTAAVTTSATKTRLYDVAEEETLMVVLPTPRDFALFMPYGRNAAKVPTNVFFGSAPDQSAITLDQTAKMRGRVYLNGSIVRDRADFGALPVFEDAVIMSGSILKSTSIDQVPTADQVDLVRSKFRKGFVTHHSATRFLLDSAAVVNNSGLPPTTMADFLSARNLGNLWAGCSPKEVVFSNALNPASGSSVNCAAGTPDSRPEEIGRLDVKAGGFPVKVSVQAKTFEKVHSPILEVEVPSDNTGLTIYGSIMTSRLVGHRNSGLTIQSTSATKVGDVGITNASDFAAFNLGVLNGSAGMTVPLYNFPVVYSSKDSSR